MMISTTIMNIFIALAFVMAIAASFKDALDDDELVLWRVVGVIAGLGFTWALICFIIRWKAS